MEALSVAERGSKKAEFIPLMEAADHASFDYYYWEKLAAKLGFNETEIEDIRSENKGSNEKCWEKMNVQLTTKSIGYDFGNTYRFYARAMYDVYCEHGKRQKAVDLGLAFLDAKFKWEIR